MNDKIMNELSSERRRQDKMWGKQDHNDLYWLAVLSEEVGELAKSIIEGESEDVRKELVQCAAVSVAWLECIERRTG